MRFTTTQKISTEPYRWTTTSYRPPATTRAPIIVPNRDSNDIQQELDSICGISEQKSTTTGLIAGGNRAARGQFPWLVAYFYNKPSSQFICGGSLVSRRIVVTAAHCVQDKDEPAPKLARDSQFYMGKHNLDSVLLEKDFQTSIASELHVHPGWKSDTTFSGDIAIAVLAETIQFNKFVKPICIWRQTSSIDDIIDGKEGVVAGWGKTERNAISTAEPLYVRIPTVSESKCLRSHPDFATILSEKSFCAGFKDKNMSPCNGDSGGGFAVENNGKTYLRGIVSSSLYDQTQLRCDSNNYAVFTDVAKYTTWIDTFVVKIG